MQQEKANYEYQKYIEKAQRYQVIQSAGPYTDSLNRTEYFQRLNGQEMGQEKDWGVHGVEKVFRGKIRGKGAFRGDSQGGESGQRGQRERRVKDRKRYKKRVETVGDEREYGDGLEDLIQIDTENKSIDVDKNQTGAGFDVKIWNNIMDGLNLARKPVFKDAPELSKINVSQIKQQIEDYQGMGNNGNKKILMSEPKRPATSHEKFAKLLKRHSSRVKSRPKFSKNRFDIHSDLENPKNQITNTDLNQKDNIITKIPLNLAIQASKSPKLTNKAIILSKSRTLPTHKKIIA